MRSWLSGYLSELTPHQSGSPPHRRDWILAAVLGLLAIAELVTTDYTWPALRLVPALLAIGLVPFRRQIPFQAGVGAFFAQFVMEVLAELNDLDIGTTSAHIVAGLLLIYAMCRWLPPRRALVGLGLTVAMVAATELADGDTLAIDALLVVPWIMLALLALAMRYRARLIMQRAVQIRLTERHALARELHDTVAHHVSAIAVQAQAAQFIATTNPVAAKDVVANIESIANQAIDEMRRMVGILRSDADNARTVGATSLAGLAAPNGRPRVTITGEASLEMLPVSVAATAYRIAQESITNARRHSRNVTFIDVDLAIDASEATLAVTNDGTPSTRTSGGGYGLVGMAERVELLGGTLETGPRPATGWQVLAIMPLAGPC